jgi:hypothetical protein
MRDFTLFTTISLDFISVFFRDLRIGSLAPITSDFVSISRIATAIAVDELLKF